MTRVLLIGPLPNPTTGVSLANQIVVDNLQSSSDFTIRFINTSYYKFDENLGTFSLSKFFFNLKLSLYSYKIFKTDIVYITPGQTFFGVLKYAIFILLTALLNKQLITHVHGNYLGKEYQNLKGIKKKIFKNLLNKTSKGVVLSESLTGNMSPFIKNEHIHVLYNFVENYLFVDIEDIKLKLQNPSPRIVFLSNLMEEKGIFELLEALKILQDEGFVYKAQIAGNIDAKHIHKTEKLFNSLKHVDYVGVVSGNQKKTLLLWGNIFILPTYYEMEGQPISILEAMATGSVVLTTSHAGIPDIFEDNVNGYYVDKKSPLDIVSKIKKTTLKIVACDKMRTENYLTTKQKYRVDNFIETMVKIFKA
ncbi:glycosyltransferase family 4 protein [Flavobacteriaceae bacterium]|nr:glycosyltransferase family 4 protein [Flavobacteriaceae bacterium]